MNFKKPIVLYPEGKELIRDADIIQVAAGVYIDSAGAIYWGEPETEGTWKRGKDGDDLVEWYYTAGAYVEIERLHKP